MINLSNKIYINLFIYLSVCLIYFFPNQYFCVSIHIYSKVNLSFNQFVSQPICLSFYLFIYLLIDLSIYLSIYLSIFLSIYISVEDEHGVLVPAAVGRLRHLLPSRHGAEQFLQVEQGEKDR